MSAVDSIDTRRTSGDFVLKSQKLATDEGFKNVSKHWYKTTMSFEGGFDQIEAGRAVTEDIEATVPEMTPMVNPMGNFVFKYMDGREFVPTPYAVCQIGGWAGTGTWYLQQLLENPVNNRGNQIFARDQGDAEAIAFALKNGLRRIDPNKKFLWRTRKDGTLRAMLSDRYAIVDNRWFLETLQQYVPGGRLSHWRGDSDTLWGNVLIPDTIREEKDSDYGGMLSVGNSEIGVRRVSSVPSTFRAICQNGCIWNQKFGKAIKQVHRGRINIEELALEIKANLNEQIPLLPQGIDKLLGTRLYAWDGASVKPLLAQVSKDFKFSKKQAGAVLQAYGEEVAITPDYDKTLFSVVNAVTRAGQRFDNVEWNKFDTYGGELMNLEETEWDNLTNRAKKLSVKEVEAVFA